MNIFLPSLPQMSAHFATDLQRDAAVGRAFIWRLNAGLQILIGPNFRTTMAGGRCCSGGWGCSWWRTLGCIFAPSIEVFLVFRMVQAMVVVGLVLGRAVVRDMYPADQAASQIGYVTMGMAVVPMIGPAIGGVLDESFGWQANFWLLFALGLVVLFPHLARPRRDGARHLQQLCRAVPRNTPSCCARAGSGGYCLSAALRLGRVLRLSRRRALRGSEVFGLSPAAVGFLLRRAGAGGISSATGSRAAFSGAAGDQHHGAVGRDHLGPPGFRCRCCCFLLGFKSALGVLRAFMTFVGFGNGMVLAQRPDGGHAVGAPASGGQRPAAWAARSWSAGGAGPVGAGGRAADRGENGAYPLIMIMLIASLLGVAAIVYTIRRERQVLR